MKSASETTEKALEARLAKCSITSCKRTVKSGGTKPGFRRVLAVKAHFDIECGGKKVSRKMEWHSEDGVSWDGVLGQGEVLRALTFLVYGSSNVGPAKKQSYPHVKWTASEIHKQIWGRAKRHIRTKKVTDMAFELFRSEERKQMLGGLQTRMNDLVRRYGSLLRKQDVLAAYQAAVNLRTVKEIMES